jgi:hypothetical protein
MEEAFFFVERARDPAREEESSCELQFHTPTV